MMAGEIGASVIVVKEIEVPPAIVALADKVSAYIDPETGEWTEKMVNRKRRASLKGYDSPSTGADTDVDATDYTDTDDALSLVATPNFPPQLGTTADQHIAYSHRFIVSNPDRPTAQSSPAIFPIDDDLALFSMEPEPSLDNADEVEDLEEGSTPDIHADIPSLSLDIEITPVYKPRPIRRPSDARTSRAEVGPTARRMQKNKDKKSQQGWHGQRGPTDPDVVNLQPVPNKQDAKAALRRMARDRRREERRKALLVPTPDAHDAVPAPATDGSFTVVAGLESLHASVQSASVVTIPDADMPAAEGLTVAAASSALGAASVADVKEPRLIVEALVVRKMCLEVEFLDFGNLGAFSLS